MVTSANCIAKWGNPQTFNEGVFMQLWVIPREIRSYLPALPKRVYCNKAIIEPLHKALNSIIIRGLCPELKTWDGLFNIRKIRGRDAWSLHSWGIALDINAATNGLGQEPTMSMELVQCFTDAGFDWGGNWRRKDGMHFQLKNI